MDDIQLSYNNNKKLIKNRHETSSKSVHQD